MSNESPKAVLSAAPVALVTGASRGIGRAVALRLARDGFRVWVNYQSSEARAQAVVDEISGCGGWAKAIRFDVASSVEVDTGFDRILKETGGVEVLVNNAGITIDGLLMRLRDEDLEKTFAVDLKGAIYCTRAASKQMLKLRRGSIIQISSVIGEMGNAGQSAYSAAKAGLIGFTKSVAKELGSRNIRANSITPGFIETEMTEALTEEQKEAILRGIPLGYLGSVDDVASAVSFLASNQSRYITGQCLGVSGGLYI